MIQRNDKWVEKCSVCGPVEGDNFLLHYLNKTEFLKIYPHIERYFDEYKIPDRGRGMSFCYECITTMELKYIQDVEKEDMPLLINTEFFSDKARKYVKRVLEGSDKDKDEVLFGFVLKKLKKLAEEVKKETVR